MQNKEIHLETKPLTESFLVIMEGGDQPAEVPVRLWDTISDERAGQRVKVLSNRVPRAQDVSLCVRASPWQPRQ